MPLFSIARYYVFSRQTAVVNCTWLFECMGVISISKQFIGLRINILTFSSYRLHGQAATVAVNATKIFFDSIRQGVGEKTFAEFLNMEVEHSLSFAIKTTSGMEGRL